MALVACAMLATPAAFAATLDRIVAVTNDEVITLSELTARTDRFMQQLRQQGTALPPRTQAERQVLDRMILERLQLQRARSSGLRVDEMTLERALQRIAEQNNMPLSRFRELVEKNEGVQWTTFREDIRNEILISRLREREVDSRVQVSDAEVDAALAAPESQAGNKEYLVSHIFLRAPEGATPDAWTRLTARANEVVRLVRQGDDFAKLAAAFSDAKDAMQGGNLEWRPLQGLPTIFSSEIVKMTPGQVSTVLRSPAGLHIFKLNDVHDGKQTRELKVEQVHARHILLRASDVLNDADAKRRLNDLRQRILNGVKFEDMARTNSSDATAVRGGDLGWLSPGDTVPDFERTMSQLKDGEISEPVQTPYGWHLIQVLERRSVDVSGERRRLEARQALRERKSEEANEVWLRQLRDEAFVEMRYDEK
ncbi:peptidylprolyl isomerase [Uliginosibacterium sp. H3]|uniref:Chaperone SurA n=1 Tax=Uliginosibacterium silvisoli TaxID=3114758 RepID=A0ABU6K1V9_9RHOO|nr:peptidylprolyl isomerase [Uliginosibacterium sp. H3]